MTVTLASRSDITLEAFRRVAWAGESVAVEPRALARADAARAAFLRLLERPDVTVYGVTSGYGDRAGVRLDAEERRRQAALAADVAGSFGEPLPARVARGIILARLANLLDGHAAAGGRLVSAVAGLLDGGALPSVPARGNGGSGEILALAHLFGPLMESVELGPKEGLALINGSPCAAALVADAALAARGRLLLAHEVFSLSVEAFRAPLEAYDPALEELWGDEHEALALRRMRELLAGAAGARRPYQAPVGYRVLPRVLGQAERAVAAAERAADVSLRSVTDNPVFVGPDAAHPDGRVFSTGGYHNAMAPAALHALATAWADLAQLAERHVEKLLYAGGEPTSTGELLSMFMMVVAGYAEDARAAAQPVILPRSGPGQNDVTAPAFLAWTRERAAGDAVDATLAVVAAVASQTLGDDEPAPPLKPLLAEVRSKFPPLAARRAFGGDAERLAGALRARAINHAEAGA